MFITLNSSKTLWDESLSHTIIDYGPEGILPREESGVRVAAKLRTNAPAIFQPSGGSPHK